MALTAQAITSSAKLLAIAWKLESDSPNESLSAYEKAIQQLPHPSLVMDLVVTAMASQQFKVAQQYLENYINQEKLQNQEKPSRFFIQAQEYLSQIKGKPWATKILILKMWLKV